MSGFREAEVESSVPVGSQREARGCVSPKKGGLTFEIEYFSTSLVNWHIEERGAERIPLANFDGRKVKSAGPSSEGHGA